MSDVPFYKRWFHSSKSDAPQLKKSKLDDLGFLELSPGVDPNVDIVAIHGLDGHRINAWTSENGAMWLKDHLPHDLPNARILTYGYDADTRSSEFTSTQTIFRHADGFLKALLRMRKHHERRPIIFIVHSLGGIILKQALVICQNELPGSPIRGLLTSTSAVLFFGTPHSGTKGVSLVQVLNQLMSVYMKTSNQIIQHLEENSEALENIQRLYLQASTGFRTVYFYEEYATPVFGGQRRVIVPHHSAVVAGDANAQEVGLAGDHCTMVKYPTKESACYTTVLYYLQEELELANASVAKKWQLFDAQQGVSTS